MGMLADANRAMIAAYTADLDLTPAERHILDWLAGWELETVARVLAVMDKARAAGPRR